MLFGTGSARAALVAALAGLLFAVTTAGAGILDTSWTAPATNADGSALTDLASYRVYYGVTNAPCPGSSFVAVISPALSPAPNQTVSVTLTGLTTGTLYYASVTATDTNGNESACSTLASALARTDFAVSPTGAVNFGSVNLGSFADQTFTVQNTGGGTLSGTVSTLAPFAVVSGGSFSLTGAGATQAVTVRFSPTVSAAVSSSVTFTAGGGSVSRLLNGTASADTTAPTIAITVPTSSATYTTTSPMLTLGGTALDDVGVTQVTWANSRGGGGTASGTTSWTAGGIVLQSGANVLTVAAKDAAANTATASLTVTLSDTSPPTVSITAPTAGTVSTTITVTATATDNVGVAGVQFKLDGANLGAETTMAPYAVTWNTTTVPNGSHTLSAVGRDTAGNLGTSASVVVTVANDTTPPALSAVTASSVTSSGATISWTTDEVSNSQVEYGVTTAYGTMTTLNASPVTSHVVLVTGLAMNTPYHVRVRSRDAAGNLALSNDFMLTTLAPDLTAPLVTITAPGAGASLAGTVVVTASATDNVGVAGVQLRLNGAALGAELTAAPYTVTWDSTTLSDGAYTLTAVARDAAGNSTTSAPVSVLVANGSVRLSPQDTSIVLNTTNYSTDPRLLTFTWPDYQPANAILMKFDLSSLPAGAVVQQATLYLALVESDASVDATYTVTAHKMVGRNPVLAAATGFTADGATGWTANACCSANVPLAQADISSAYDTRAIDKTPGYKTWTLTALVQEWLSNPATNFGLLLNADASKLLGRYRFFASMKHPDATLRPYLRITYTVPPTRDTTPPAVAITAPSTGSSLAGTVAVTASATDNVGVAGVQLRLNGAALGAELTAAPYTVAWDSTTLSDGPYILTAVARDAAGNATTSAPVGVTVANGSVRLSPEDTSIILNTTNYSADPRLLTFTWPDYQPANAILMKFDLSSLPAGAVVQQATLSLALIESDSTVDATYTVTAHKMVGRNPVLAAATGFTADGVTSWTPNACCSANVPLAEADISSAYDTQAIDKTLSYKTWTMTTMVQEWLAAPATNAGLLLNADTSALAGRYRYFASMEHPDGTIRPYLRITYTVPRTRDTTPPTIAITAPGAGASLAGTVAVTANGTDNVGVAGVQFRLDGAALGAELTAAPYTVSWDSTTLSNGPHTLTAVARDAAGNATTSAPVSVTVANSTVQILLAPQDTFIDLSANNFSTATMLQTFTWPDNQAANAILMKFDLAALPPGAVVYEATLHLALLQSDAAPEPTYTVTAHKLVAKNPDIASATGYTIDGVTAWTPNVCCYSSVPLAQADISPAYDTRAIDKTSGDKVWTITTMVQEWLANPAINAGLLLNADASALAGRYRSFASTHHPKAQLRPYLSIRYSVITSLGR